MIYILALLALVVVGFVIVPATGYVLRDGVPRSIGELLAIGHLMLVNLHWGGTALVYRSTSQYTLNPLRVSQDGIEVKLNGKWRNTRGSLADLDRFAFGWFTMLNERGDQIAPFEVTAYDHADLEEIKADGGRIDAQLPDIRGGSNKDEQWRMFSPVLDPACDAAGSGYGGPIIDLSKVAISVKRTNQESNTKDGLLHALKEFGGLNRIGPLATALGFLVCLVFGSMMTWVAMGGI